MVKAIVWPLFVTQISLISNSFCPEAISQTVVKLHIEPDPNLSKQLWLHD